MLLFADRYDRFTDVVPVFLFAWRGGLGGYRSVVWERFPVFLGLCPAVTEVFCVFSFQNSAYAITGNVYTTHPGYPARR